ncbi:hypothetical protein MNBD_NITROSPINAE02-977 [hydrothermal vent metagenome]|uniref:DUF192 domain-containing protein n=1 Tax=hydrothermal vent metagenome TaxID=652676 RepID=A0A3B1BPT7_9ZZZZ
MIVIFLGSCASARDQNLQAKVALVDALTPQTVSVEVMSSGDQRAKGLMYRDGLEEGTGMFFVYPEEQLLAFWMKNMRFSIDIIFIDKNFVIRKIWRSVPPCVDEPCEIYQSVENVRYTLEVDAGFCEQYGVMEKQRIQYFP